VALTLFGVIEDWAYWEAEVAPHLGGAVRYGGHLPGGDLAHALARASVFVFTPLWDEPFGLAAVEAMACGLPVASTDMGAAQEVIGPRAGRFADPEDGPEGLAAAIREALTIPRAMARADAERYGIDLMVDAYEAAYATAVANRPATPPARTYPAIELTVAPPAAIPA
jgi:glycosyltransferase involved in cell wall biosynthesis